MAHVVIMGAGIGGMPAAYEMRDKLDAKLGDPELYEPERKDEVVVWQKKHAEVHEALDRAEEIWLRAQEKLEKAET